MFQGRRRRVPRRVGRGTRHVTIEIRRPVVPPDRTTFPQQVFGFVDLPAGRSQAFGIAGTLRHADGPPGLHEQDDVSGACVGRQVGIGSAP